MSKFANAIKIGDNVTDIMKLYCVSYVTKILRLSLVTTTITSILVLCGTTKRIFHINI